MSSQETEDVATEASWRITDAEQLNSWYNGVWRYFSFFPPIKEANSRSKACVGIIHVSRSFISLSDKSGHVASAAVYANNDTFPSVPDRRAPADHLHSRLYLLQMDEDEDTE